MYLGDSLGDYDVEIKCKNHLEPPKVAESHNYYNLKTTSICLDNKIFRPCSSDRERPNIVRLKAQQRKSLTRSYSTLSNEITARSTVFSGFNSTKND